MSTQRPTGGAKASASNVSRRSFLKASAFAAGAMTLGAPMVLRAADATTKPGAAATKSSAALNKLNMALIGCGGMGRGDMKSFLDQGENIVAICDVDEHQIGEAKKLGGKALENVKVYSDYRKLFDDEKSIDAIMIATPDHWHAPLCKRAIEAGKHVYCQKPLTHSIAEARALRELSRNSKVVTQMGNQGSASGALRRAIEVIQAGIIGQVHDIHSWVGAGGFPHGEERAPGEDAVPAHLNWDMWVGPSPLRPYKNGKYHPYAWRGWYDFGSGQFGDFFCHCINLPMRALKLTYPNKIEVSSNGVPKDNENYPRSNKYKLHFAANNGLDALTIHWYDGGPKPEADIVKDVVDLYKTPRDGVLIIGEKGTIYSDPWCHGAHLKLKGDARLTDINRHEALKTLPVTLPRSRGHYQEFADACKGKGTTFSPFETGGHLTEIALTGALAQRLRRDIDWNGEKMEVPGDPSAERFIKPAWRKNWIA